MPGTLDVLLVLEDPSERVMAIFHVNGVGPEELQGSGPIDALGDAGGLDQVQAAQCRDPPRHRAGEVVGDPRCAESDDGRLAVDVRVVGPVIATAAFQRVVHVSGSVARQDHDRRFNRGDAPDLRDRDGELTEELEKERLELVVGPIDLVEKEDRSPR